MKQQPLEIALEGASTSYRAGGVDVAYYLITNCGCGNNEEKMILFCRACFHGKLDVIKKLVSQHKIDPHCE